MPNCLLGALIMYSLCCCCTYTHTHIYQVHFRRSSRSLFLSFYGIDLFLGLGTNPFRDTRSVSSFTTTTTTTTIYSADCNPILLLLNSFFVFGFLFFLFPFSRKLLPVPQSLIISRIFRQYGFFFFSRSHISLISAMDGTRQSFSFLIFLCYCCCCCFVA